MIKNRTVNIRKGGRRRTHRDKTFLVPPSYRINIFNLTEKPEFLNIPPPPLFFMGARFFRVTYIRLNNIPSQMWSNTLLFPTRNRGRKKLTTATFIS